MIVLGIETSCDETAAAVVKEDRQILSNIIFSQIEEHQKYNGIVPEIATRAHIRNIDKVIDEAMQEANCSYNDIDAIAVTAGPGLVGCLIVGIMVAKGISFASNKPLLGINHLEGHALTTRMTNNIEFPYLLLLASGGHCQLIIVEEVGKYIKLGETVDDSAGESFDKIAKMLNLGYPGGPIIEKRAALGNPNKIKFPRPMISHDNYNFSFSGLKTAVRNTIASMSKITEENINDICASFQEAVKDIFIKKIIKTLPYFKKKYTNAGQLVISGGVAANKYINNCIALSIKEYDMGLITPPIHLCTDNAAMIAWAGIERARKKMFNKNNITPKPKWPL